MMFQSKREGAVLTVVIILLLGGAGYLAISKYKGAKNENPAVQTPSPSLSDTVSTNGITFSQPQDFGLAVSEEQILNKSYIPPCDSNFDYCLYYLDEKYKGTNFESAGLRIKKRDDLKTKESCLSAQPQGFSGQKPEILNFGNYSSSVFSNVGTGAAGHFTEGSLYRLAFNGICYEFETRIGQSQFANYPPGTIREFTDANKKQLQNRLREILDEMTFSSGGQKIVFPEIKK